MKKKAKQLTLAEVQAMGQKASEASRNRPDFEIYTLGDYLLACEYFPLAAAKYRARNPSIDPDGDGGKNKIEEFKKQIHTFVQTLPPRQRLLVYLTEGRDLKTLSDSDSAQLKDLAKSILEQAKTNKTNARKPRKPIPELETTESISAQVRKDFDIMQKARKGVQKKVLYSELADRYDRATSTIQAYLKKSISAATR